MARFERCFHKFSRVDLLNLKTQMIVDLRTVNGLMAARAPAGPATQERGVVLSSNVNLAGGRLLLEVAAQAERGVARNQQSCIHAAVRRVAGGAAFAHRLVLKHERTKLRRVALGADFILRQKFRPAAFNYGAFMRIVAVPTTHLAFDNGMVRRQIEFSPLMQVTLKTGFRRFAGIEDGVGRAAGFNVQAAGPVTGFAPDVPGIVPGRFQMIMGRGVEAAVDVLMALLARLRADISGAGNLRRREKAAGDGAAGNHHRRHERHAENQTRLAAMRPHPGFAAR